MTSQQLIRCFLALAFVGGSAFPASAQEGLIKPLSGSILTVPFLVFLGLLLVSTVSAIIWELKTENRSK